MRQQSYSAFSRPMRRQQWIAGLIALALLIVVSTALAFDRAAPVNLVSGEVIPENARPGGAVTFRWHTTWYRSCRASVYREVIGSDDVVRIYKPYRASYPARLGRQTIDTEDTLATSIPPGHSSYRAVFIFEECGITSRWFPLRIETPDIIFNVAQ